MKRYPKYKDSGVEWIGEIPEHWKVKRLKYMSNILFSSVDRHFKDDELTVPVCHYPDVYYNEKINSHTKLKIGSCSEQEYEKYQLKKDDVIITKDSESPDDIGVPAFVEKNLEKSVCGYHLSLISTTGDELLGGFLFRFIQSDKVGRYFEIHSNGITRFGLGKPFIENLFVTLPINSEQEKIITYLDQKTHQIDSLIEKKQKQIELLKEQRTAIINHAVTKGLNPNEKMKDSGIEWLGEIPVGWELIKNKHISEFSNGYSYSSNEWVEIGFPVIRMSNISETGKLNINDNNTKYISEKSAEKTKSFRLQKNDVLIAMTDMSSRMRILGKTIIFDEDGEYYLNQRVGRMKIDNERIELHFFHYVSNSENTRNQIKSDVYPTVQYNASTETIKNTFISFPSLPEQKHIANYLDNKTDQIDTLIKKKQKQIELLKEYRTALISDAVTGKIDVRDEVPS